MDWLWMILVAVRGFSAAPEDAWATRLAELDQARASAFAAADASGLDAVYTPGSSGRRTDAATIEAYARRGGRVMGAELVIISCRIVGSSADRVQLEVVDRLGRARVRWDDGGSTTLPRDLPSRRAVTMVRTEHGWRIADASAVTPPR